MNQMTGTNIGVVILQAFGLLVGVLLIALAFRALLSGDFTGPKKVIYGFYSGVAHIKKVERPVAFWFCVISYLCFGLAALAAVWFVI